MVLIVEDVGRHIVVTIGEDIEGHEAVEVSSGEPEEAGGESIGALDKTLVGATVVGTAGPVIHAASGYNAVFEMRLRQNRNACLTGCRRWKSVRVSSLSGRFCPSLLAPITRNCQYWLYTQGS